MSHKTVIALLITALAWALLRFAAVDGPRFILASASPNAIVADLVAELGGLPKQPLTSTALSRAPPRFTMSSHGRLSGAPCGAAIRLGEP